jgi:glutaredoxin
MKFTVYSKDGCPYCTKVKQVLQLTNLEYVVYTLGTDFNREGFLL